MIRPLKEYPLSFQRRVDVTNNCWIWTGYNTPKGYGIYHKSGRTCRAHRWSYEYSFGLIPNELVIDHLCRNRNCVNPAHLEAVTQKENIFRSPFSQAVINSQKTHCKRGHLFSKATTYIKKNGCRECKVCRQQYMKLYKPKQELQYEY